MSEQPSPWFVGAWRRRSIVVPGGEPTEPCEAWWVQTTEAFVDVRVVLAGQDHNGLPYSSTRAFAGRFELTGDEARWHVELDSDGVVPRTDRAAAAGLYLAADDPLLMVEDSPGRFREEWVQQAATDEVECVRTGNIVAVRVGEVSGAVWAVAGVVFGRVWHGDRSIGIGPA